ncbi:MAG: hypothetical protein ACOX9R_08460 [Armatimonadota bacterium]|jgi:hypothetical protein
MPTITTPGYNFLRGRAKREAAEFLRDWSDDRLGAEEMSIVALLRHIERKERLPKPELFVNGFERLWEIMDPEEHDALSRRVQDILSARMNWLNNQNPHICFVLPPDVTFIPGRRLELRLGNGDTIDLYDIFGHFEPGDSTDHYKKGFNVRT